MCLHQQNVLASNTYISAEHGRVVVASQQLAPMGGAAVVFWCALAVALARCSDQCGVVVLQSTLLACCTAS
jgi:hypothetical protein